MKHWFLAIDLGAASGRLIAGRLWSGRLSLKEIYRFPTGLLEIRGKFYWNIGLFYSEILKGLEICVKRHHIQPESLGIDTWGVDYGLLSSDGTLLGLPYAYRDPRTANAVSEFTAKMPEERVYQLTGALIASYNTLFQLYAAKKYHPELLEAASSLLFIPDLLAYFLTGEKCTEISFASTSQLYNPSTGSWEEEIFSALGISPVIMQKLVQPGEVIGYTGADVCRTTGMQKIPVMAVATHDTSSAIAAIPDTCEERVFISSGTWSLMGFSSETPLLTAEAMRMNFTNEVGWGGIYHVMKNHMGFWLLQQCKKQWKEKDYTYSQLNAMGRESSLVSVVDVDDPAFLNPPDMLLAITEFCRKTGQRAPSSPGDFTLLILRSLALKYGETLEQIRELSGRQIYEIFITGGGVGNTLLCQFTANVTGIRVKTGLSEGTSAGNLIVQASAMSYVRPGVIQQILAASVDVRVYEPQDTAGWRDARIRYREICAMNRTHGLAG